MAMHQATAKMSKGRSDAGGLWAITAYFNPVGYQRRLNAYRMFRQALGIPLVAVELSFDGRFSLRDDDAEIVMKIPGRDVMWQKERLLNLALGALPEDCDKVAWLDCDILFERDDWPARACEALASSPIIQLYQRVRYLGPQWCQGERRQDHEIQIRPSLVSGVGAGLAVEACLVHPSPEQRPGTYANGMAWAARRELLDHHGLYDACIIGGGDRAISSAAYGCFEHVRNWHAFNERQWTYYLNWARPFHEACKGRVGVIDGDVYHQWHGKASDRGLGTRHNRLGQFDFDPFTDLALDERGCWRWNSDKPELHAYVRDYFASRREDG